MLLLIDNYDSFTYNLYHLFLKFYKDIVVKRNDEITAEDIAEYNPSGIIISPGPGRPEDSGVSIDAVSYALEKNVPLLGVCLGHQVIGAYFGASVIRAKLPVHGETDLIFHNSLNVFRNCKNPFRATRYHSLVVDSETVKPPLVITAVNEEGIVMGIAHLTHPISGVQFHPESFLSEEGEKIASNFIEEVRKNASHSREHQEACKKG